MAHRLIIGVILICLLTSTWAEAQLAVADAPVLGAIVSMAATITAMLNAIRQQAAALADWGAIVAEIQAMAQLIADVEALVSEIQGLDEGWSQLVDSGSVLCSVDEMISWKGQALQWQHRGFALIRTMNRLIGRTIHVLVSLQRVLGGIIGAVAGAQSSSAYLALIAANLQWLQSMTGSFASASLGKDIIASVLGIQLICLHGLHMEGWGTYSR